MNEYRALGGIMNNPSHSQFLQQLINEGKGAFKGGREFKGKKDYFMISCYLGRANDLYEAPLMWLKLMDVELVEDEALARPKGVCCGAWWSPNVPKEAEPANKEINIEGSTEEDLATGRLRLYFLSTIESRRGGVKQ